MVRGTTGFTFLDDFLFSFSFPMFFKTWMFTTNICLKLEGFMLNTEEILLLGAV